MTSRPIAAPPTPPAIDSAALPTFTFLDRDGTASTLDLAASGGYVVAASRFLAGACPSGAVVGIMAKPGPDLVRNWLAAVHAGLRPLVMQYPTPKQSAAYWESSVRNTVEVAGLAAIIADDGVAARLPAVGRVITQAEIDRLDPVADAGGFTVGDYSIVQLSSGTTGYRKATEFTGAALARHVADYNATLDLRPDRDVIVSWLPLYHDMGYVACFVMPMLLGVPVVMMDPIDWVADPAMLFRAIERHRGTICYMPNFGFEVMSRQETSDCSSMRWWISCSEPVSAVTARKFLDRLGAGEALFAPCYAMAENIFAMTIRRGIATHEINGAEVISCGAPIDGVELKIVDEEIWVRSPTSLTAYMNGEPIVDEAGFYPTGDLGLLVDGELYVSGRKQDLIIQAGRKFMLSDIDLVLNRLRPEVKGRAAAVQIYDDRLGTNVALVLIEAQDFFRRDDADEIAAALSAATDIDQLQVAFVPPRFLTKTSSGKFNRRKSAADWLLHRKSRDIGAETDIPAEMDAAFAQAPWDVPAGEALDSLSLTILRMLLNEAGVRYDSTRTLAEMRSEIDAKTDVPADEDGEGEVIHIVSLADRGTLRGLKDGHLKALAKFFGRKVTFEHLCLPPTPIILSDLIFTDYFGPRIDPAAMTAVHRGFDILRSASIILIDDVAEFNFSPNQVYGVLSHNLERSPEADLVSIRWQRYAQNHHLLPLTVVSGADLSYATRNDTIAALSAYLSVPIMRIATLRAFAKYTRNWEYRGWRLERGELERVSISLFVKAVMRWSRALGEPIKSSARRMPRLVTGDDLAHFCSHFVDREAVDIVVDRFDRFCLAGQESSVPYVAKRIEAAGKSFVRSPGFAKEVVGPLEDDFDALISCGPQGTMSTGKPFFAFMKAVAGGPVHNVSDKTLKKIRFTLHEVPVSGRDWYYFAEADRRADRRLFTFARSDKDVRARNKLRIGRRRERDRQREAATAATSERP